MLLIPWPNQHWDAIHEKLVYRQATEKDLASEKIWVFNCFGKNSHAENFQLPQKSAPVNYDIPNSINNKQTDPANMLVENERHELRNAVGKAECRTCFEKIQKFQLVFRRELAGKKTAKTITAASRMSAVPSISAKILPFPSSLFRQGPNNTFCSLKNPKTETFICHNSTKNKFGCRKFGI